jgi:predicted TIM-barrel fold metal-dependent hydrolase
MARKQPESAAPRAGSPVCATRRALVLSGAAAAAAAALPAAGQAPSPAGLIDVHHHAIPDFWFEAAKPGIMAQVGGRLGPQWTGWTPQTSLAAMDRNRVAMALLSITAPGVWIGGVTRSRSLTHRCNERLAEIVRTRPDRFGFHAALALPDVDGSVAEIEHAYDVLHADGVGLMTSYDGKYLGDKRFTPVFEALNRRKAVVYVHPAAPACCTALMPDVSPNYIEFLHDTNRAILNLMFTGTLHRFPDIRFVFSHSGASLPMMAGRVAGLLARDPETAAKVPEGFEASFRKLHFDVANAANRAAFGALTAIVPTSQVVFGTDYPIIPIEATAGGLERLSLSAADYAGVAQSNALRLYPQLAERMRKAG